MKYFFLVIYLGVATFLCDSCKKDKDTTPAFDYEQTAGIWVPYEVTDELEQFTLEPLLQIVFLDLMLKVFN